MHPVSRPLAAHEEQVRIGSSLAGFAGDQLLSCGVGMEIAHWRQRINSALDSGAVLEVMNAFLESLDRDERRALPPDLRMRILDEPDDIAQWAYVLANAWLDSGPASGEGILNLGRISVVFSQASRRLAQLSVPTGYRRFQDWIDRQGWR